MNDPRFTGRTMPLDQLPLDQHRALVDAGLAPMDEYVARFQAIECDSHAPPILVPREPLFAEEHQLADYEPQPKPERGWEMIVIPLIVVSVVAIGACGLAALFGKPL